MKKLLGALAVVILAVRLPAQSGIAAKMPTLRVALMDFICEDDSYRSTVAMADFTAALQAEVSGDTNYDWVERAELEKVADEFKLAGFGLIDRSEAIRSGRWVKADWGIFGDVSTNWNGNRKLSLEVVDLQRADVLVETNLLLSTTEDGPFRMKSEYMPLVSAALRSLLENAQKISRNLEKQDVVAFLFLPQSGMGGGFDNLENDFRQSLSAASTNSQKFHLVQFQRSGAAMDEANLVLSGLAETDSNSWEKVADHYVWGDARVNDRKIFDWKTRDWQDERKLEVTLNVWDGRGEPQVVVLTVTNETSEAIGKKLTLAVGPLLRRDLTKPIAENIRSRISDSLVARYTGLPMNFSFDSPEGRRQWFDAVQLLETACFFNPGNAAAREQLLRLRWGTALPGYNAESPAAQEEFSRLLLTGYLKSASRNEFFFARRRSKAWGKYVEQFGFTTALAKPNSPSIATEYVLSAWRPFEMFGYSQYNQTQWGVPRDAGLREVTEWQNQFGSEFVSRLLKAPDQFNSTYLEALKGYFKGIGQPGGEQKLLAQLKPAYQGKHSEPTNSPPPPTNTGQKVRLPRVTELDAAKARDIFSVRPMTFSPPLVEPDIQTIPFPSGVQIKGVKSMVFQDDTLWLAVEVAEPLEIKTVNGQIEKEFQPVSTDHIRLWELGANTQKLEPVTGPLATNDINRMMFHGNTLWLVLNDDGIAALNVKTGELRRYESSAGIISTNQFALADISRGIVAIGGLSDLSILENGTDAWKPFLPGIPHQNFMFGGDLRRIAGLKDKLLLYNSQLLLCDFKSNTWTRMVDPPSLDKMGRINSLASDGKENLWIASDSGLHGIDPNTGKIRSQWIPVSPTVQVAGSLAYPGQAPPHKPDSQLVKEIRQKLELRQRLLEARKTDTNQSNLFVPESRLSAGVLSVSPDDDFLWVFTTEAAHPLLYHPGSQSWVGGFSLQSTGNSSTLACGGGKLWLAARPGENFAILEIDAGTLKSTPRERWLPDSISKEELAARISDLPKHERAVYYFFSGDDAAAVKLLQTQVEDELDAESLFLLQLSFAEMGESNQASHFEQKLTEAFPDSVFTKVVSFNDLNHNRTIK